MYPLGDNEIYLYLVGKHTVGYGSKCVEYSILAYLPSHSGTVKHSFINVYLLHGIIVSFPRRGILKFQDQSMLFHDICM